MNAFRMDFLSACAQAENQDENKFLKDYIQYLFSSPSEILRAGHIQSQWSDN